LLQGLCANLRLVNIELAGFKKSAIRLRNCSGDDRQPVTIERLHCRAAAGTVAIVFDEGADGSRLLTSNVKVIDGRFDGPCQAAFRIESSVIGIAIERNRFHRANVGIDYVRHNPPYNLGMTLRSNTFAELEYAFHFQALPPEQTGCTVRIENNLFFRLQRVMRVDDLLPPLAPSVRDRVVRTFTPIQGNVSDIAIAEGLPSLACNALDFALPTDPKNAKDFLRYPRESPLAHAGANQSPVGVPPPD